ncbi:lipoprotein-anchoring transpeptidase ErfK/SrfK [Kaistia defluvii]|uniref:Lipoprotein-anchoring transpeptidase ErfK/SrfK n=1 Tax=Kaistia defluvii TaxID=410841 RepID=A0ABV2QUQ4_9HYPH
MVTGWASLPALLVSLVLAVIPTSGSFAGELVAFTAGDPPGTIVVRTEERRLYLVLPGGRALRYLVGVGRSGRQWVGASSIDGKHLRPNWAPPAAIKRARPNVPDFIPSGSPANPMGAAAMTLAGGEYAIHGTNQPNSVGGFVSFGCIRMHNEDILDLFGRVNVGTPVVVRR